MHGLVDGWTYSGRNEELMDRMMDGWKDRGMD